MRGRMRPTPMTPLTNRIRALTLGALAATASPAAPTPQQSDAARSSAEEPADLRGLRGELVDGVVAIADEQIITLLELEQLVAGSLRSQPVNSPEQELALRGQALRRLLLQRLSAQAGSELGLPTEAVTSQAESIERGRIGDDGLFAYRESLREQGVDPLTARRRTRNEIYRYQWEAFVTGAENYAGGRPAVDAFVRPGELRALYEVRLDELGSPSEVSLQVITIDARASGGQEYAGQAGEAVLEELAAGASWNELAEVYSSTFRETFGIRERSSLARIGDADLRRFAAEADPGTVSGVLPRRDRDGELVGVQIARLLERTEGEPPPAFDDPRLQGILRTELVRRRDAARLAIAEDRLLVGGYAWTASEGTLDLRAPQR
jgi:hypothetical protein